MTHQKPYLSWEIDKEEFKKAKRIEDKAKFLVRYAILAPSSHNTQPWKFQIESNVIRIFPDLQRSLIYSDRIHREMYISLGCALANLLIAADYFDLKTDITYLPEGDLENTAIVIKLTEGGGYGQKLKALFPYIVRRVSNRHHFEDKKISNNVLDELITYKDEKLISIHLIQDILTKKKIIEAVEESVLFAFNDDIFKAELSGWVRSNYTTQYDGMPLFGFGIPGPISLFAPYLIKYMPARVQAKIDTDLLNHSAAFLILTSKEDNKDSWIKTGKTYELLTLACLQNEMATSPMAGIVEYEETNKKLKKILGSNDRPLFFARIGYTNKDTHHSPRRSIDEVLI